MVTTLPPRSSQPGLLGIALVAVLIPEPHEFSETGPLTELYAKIAKTFAARNIPLVNPLAEFAAAFGNDPSAAWVHRTDPHPNTQAHAIIAEALVRDLAARQF